MPYYIYILSKGIRGTLYIGMTNDLIRRIYEHKNELIPGFSSKYKTHRLVYFESCEDVRSAITREKQLKKWRRAWKIELIESINPKWDDLYSQIT
ncbi:MAG: GIY-YIG nuclease family protein [Candidatus Zixiibacteriota bacterium]